LLGIGVHHHHPIPPPPTAWRGEGAVARGLVLPDLRPEAQSPSRPPRPIIISRIRPPALAKRSEVLARRQPPASRRRPRRTPPCEVNLKSSLRVSDNRRCLVHPDGSPFFYLGDTCWELFHRLDRADADHYLENRAALAFTVIQAVVLAEQDGLRVEATFMCLGHIPVATVERALPCPPPIPVGQERVHPERWRRASCPCAPIPAGRCSQCEPHAKHEESAAADRARRPRRPRPIPLKEDLPRPANT